MDDKALDQAVKDGWITSKQRTKIPNRNYLVYLVKTNKEKGYKPKPSLTPAQWAKVQAERSAKAKKKKTPPQRRKAKATGQATQGK